MFSFCRASLTVSSTGATLGQANFRGEPGAAATPRWQPGAVSLVCPARVRSSNNGRFHAIDAKKTGCFDALFSPVLPLLLDSIRQVCSSGCWGCQCDSPRVQTCQNLRDEYVRPCGWVTGWEDLSLFGIDSFSFVSIFGYWRMQTVIAKTRTTMETC